MHEPRVPRSPGSGEVLQASVSEVGAWELNRVQGSGLRV